MTVIRWIEGRYARFWTVVLGILVCSDAAFALGYLVGGNAAWPSSSFAVFRMIPVLGVRAVGVAVLLMVAALLVGLWRGGRAVPLTIAPLVTYSVLFAGSIPIGWAVTGRVSGILAPAYPVAFGAAYVALAVFVPAALARKGGRTAGEE